VAQPKGLVAGFLTVRSLVEMTLAMRPDLIVVGEVRLQGWDERWSN
jgi:Flp pilus assembly CpaF family ATPase